MGGERFIFLSTFDDREDKNKLKPSPFGKK